jgi:hypothetical protein
MKLRHRDVLLRNRRSQTYEAYCIILKGGMNSVKTKRFKPSAALGEMKWRSIGLPMGLKNDHVMT